MSISSINSATYAYSIAASNARAAMPTESGNLNQAAKTDMVTLSSKAQSTVYSKSVAEQVNEMTQRIQDIYEKTGWGVLEFGKKPLSDNLPENQPLINQLKAEHPQANPERKEEISYRLRTLQEWGDQYYFPDEEALVKVRDIQMTAVNQFNASLSRDEIQAQMENSRILRERLQRGDSQAEEELKAILRQGQPEHIRNMTEQQANLYGQMLEQERFGK